MGTTDRDKYLKYRFGISERDYNNLLQKQGGCCGVCGKTPRPDRPKFACDHDHKSGEIRGVLCYVCNRKLIGRFRDPELYFAAARYLTGPFTGWFVPDRRKRRGRRSKHSPPKNTKSKS